jgi:hypothetical protein
MTTPRRTSYILFSDSVRLSPRNGKALENQAGELAIVFLACLSRPYCTRLLLAHLGPRANDSGLANTATALRQT